MDDQGKDDLIGRSRSRARLSDRSSLKAFLEKIESEDAKKAGIENEKKKASVYASQAKALDIVSGEYSPTIENITRLIKGIFAGLWISFVLFLIILGVATIFPELIEENALTKIVNYFQYFMIASFSSITIIVSSCFLGFKGLVGFLVEKTAKTSSSE